MRTSLVPVSCTVWISMASVAILVRSDSLQGTPRIKPFSFQPRVLVEEKVMASCLASGRGPFSFTWEKDGLEVLTETIRVEHGKDFSLLIIDHVQPVNQGNYTCHVRNTLGADSHTASLLVAAPPTWKTEPSDMKMVVGNQLLLPCSALGSPEPRVHWRRLVSGNMSGHPESLHQSPNGSLLFTTVREGDSGMYECEIDNGIPPSLKKNVTLLVFGRVCDAMFPEKGTRWCILQLK